MAPFSDYVRSLRGILDNLNASSKLCVVAGNETCDVDSVVCALTYAHYISTTGNFVPEGAMTLPLVQCRREELVARADVKLLLEEMGVQEEWLVLLDLATMATLTNIKELSVILVDHNEPTGWLCQFSSCVIRVVDHRKTTPSSMADRDGVTSLVELVGSCSSLVSRELLDDDSYEMEESVARSLTSVILSDTGKLLTEGRVTDRDEAAVKDLAKYLPSSFDSDKQYARYVTAKFDISKLSTRQVLERDFKQEQYGRYVVGFCTITSKLSEYLTHPDAAEGVAEFYHEHSLSALIMFGVSLMDVDKAELEKQIAMYQPEGAHYDFAESLTVMFESNKEIGCHRLEGEGLGGFDGVIMHQGNTSLSRKQIIPIFSRFMDSLDVNSLDSNSMFPAEGLSPPSTPPLSSDFPLEPDVHIISPIAEENSTADSSSGATGGGSVETTEATGTSQVEGKGKKVGVSERIPEYTAEQECKDRNYRRVEVGGEETTISMAMVEPYRKLVQHAGYVGKSKMALLVISAAHLPPRSLPNYQHVLHHTIYYMLSTVDKLIVDNYVIVYFHSGAPRRSMPSVPVLHKIYRMIDRRLKKQLSKIYLVHSTFWVKCMVNLARPLLSKKFWRKVQFVATLDDLSKLVAVDTDFIPESVLARDVEIMASRNTDRRLNYENKKQEQSSTPEEQSSPPGGQNSPPGEQNNPMEEQSSPLKQSTGGTEQSIEDKENEKA